MTLNPALQLAMLCNALLAGLALGLFYDVGRVVRVLLGAHTPPPFMAARYRRPLPLVGVGVPFRASGGWHAWRVAAVFAGDLLLCLTGYVAVELILLYFNDGALRLAVPLLMPIGFALWRRTAARLMTRVNAWLAYVLGVVLVYLWALVLLPFRLLRIVVVRPIRRLLCTLRLKRRGKISAALCRRQLAWAAVGFGDIQKGEVSPSKSKKKREVVWIKSGKTKGRAC